MYELGAATAARSPRYVRFALASPAGESAILREVAEQVAGGVLVEASGSLQPQQEGSMEQNAGMWGPYEPAAIGEPLELLEQAGRFVLVDASVREGVATQYGPRDAVDLVVATTEPGVTRLVSGFAAGIVGQVKRKADGDLPAVATIVQQQTGRGATRALQLVEAVPAGTDPSAVAAQLAVPLRPLNGSANGHGQPAGDDGIPY
jgi:hypothetical protein